MEGFYDGLSDEQIKILKGQIERFNNFIGKERKEIIPSDKMMLPEGTLIHGTPFNEKSLMSIAKSGIITGEYFGIEEDGETFKCADFHRVKEDIPLEEYNDKFTYSDGRCPFGNRGKKTVAFIIYPNESLNEIASYDCYRDGTKESEIAKSFVNMAGLPVDDKDMASSILFGVPSSFINGIVIGDNIINEDNIKFLKDLFPGCYMVRNNGEVIFKQTDTEEITSLRVEKIRVKVEKEEMQKEIDYLNNQISRMVTNNEELWVAVAGLSFEEIAGIFERMGYQGNKEDLMRYAENLKERYETNKGGMER